jgi:Lamin Tail Domain
MCAPRYTAVRGGGVVMTGGRALLSLGFLLISCVASRAAIVVNELYYDHPGADAGFEFVELLNTGADAVAIGDLSLEFHNGSGTGWSVVTRVPAGIVLDAGALYVIGASAVVPPPDVVVALALQNGPDAIRIVAGDGTVLDVVGYGGLDDPPYVETLGVAAIAAGMSIARIPDGADTDDNAIDFVAASPTPKRFNVARHDVAIDLAADTPSRAGRDAAGIERIAIELDNRGLVDIPAASVTIAARDSTRDSVADVASATNAVTIAPGASERLVLTLALTAGYHWIDIVARYAPDERSGNDRVTLVRRAGRIPVLVSEVWSAPRDGCPQFVELFNAGAFDVDVGGWSLRDTRATPVPLAVDSLVLAPRAFLAVTPSPSALIACVPETPAPATVGVDGSWPSFNRSGTSIADSVVVFDAFGIRVDAVGYPPVASGTSGRSLERVDLYEGARGAVWRLSPSPSGCTPGLPNGASLYDAPAAGRLDVSPNPFSPARGDVLRVALDGDESVTRVAVHVFDVAGRRVAEIGSATTLPAVFLWDGSDTGGAVVRAGLYVVACEEFQADGSRGAVLKVVVGCASRIP